MRLQSSPTFFRNVARINADVAGHPNQAARAAARPAVSYLLLGTALALGACSNSHSGDQVVSEAANLRSLSADEAKSDLNELVNAIKTFYGPFDYKQKKFNFKIDDAIAAAQNEIQNSPSDAATFGVYQRLLAKLQDAHVSISFPSSSSVASAYSIPIFATPVEDSVVVDAVDQSLAQEGIARGDEIVTVDGKTPAAYLPIFKKYASLANEVSNRHLVYMLFSRPFYMTEAAPTKPSAHVVFKKADGSSYALDLVWRTKISPTATTPIVAARLNTSFAALTDFNAAAETSLLKEGNAEPFFINALTTRLTNLVKVTSNSDYRKKYGLTDDKTPEIYAALYKFAGKTILLVRQPSYSVSDDQVVNTLKAYVALLDQYQGLADVLVLDQTHNPGGSAEYCQAFYSLFAAPQAAGPVEFVRADRKWVFDLKINALKGLPAGSEDAMEFSAMGAQVESAYDAGQLLTPVALPVFTGKSVIGTTGPIWNKPMLVLTDELSASGGDLFPMLIKANKTAKIFGARTMGAGGNVEQVVTLPNSQTSVNLTRGLFLAYKADGSYKPEDFVENNGVTPDYPYSISLKDYRSGYGNYVLAFSQKAVDQIPAETQDDQLKDLLSLPQSN